MSTPVSTLSPEITTVGTVATVGTESARGDRVWWVGLAAGAGASVATVVTAAVARAAGVDLAISDERIPLNGFAVLTMVGTLIGITLASVLSRLARTPRTTFVRTTVALTVLSIVPDVVADTTTGSKAVLAMTHVMAAAIVIPALAARLRH